MKHNYNEIDFFMTVFSLGLYYLADWGSDISTIVALFRSGHQLEGFVTISSLIFATYSLNALQAYWDKRDYGRSCLARIFYILPLGLLYQRYRCMGLLLPIVFYKKYIKGHEEEMQQQLLLEDWKSIKLALIQTTLPNYIHVVWNFHPIFLDLHRAADLRRAESATVIISFLVCVLGLCDYHHHRHIVLRTLKKLSFFQNFAFRILNLLSTGLMTAARLFAVTAVLGNNATWLPFIVAGLVHYSVSWGIIIWKDWDAFLKHEIPRRNAPEKAIEDFTKQYPHMSSLETTSCKWFGRFLLSLILLGAPIYETFKYPVMTVYLLENVGLICSWFLTTPDSGDWELKMMLTVVVGNVLGVALSFIMGKVFLKHGEAKPHIFLINTQNDFTEMVPFSAEKQVVKSNTTDTRSAESASTVLQSVPDKKGKLGSDTEISVP